MASTLELLLLARMAATPVGRAHATAAQSGITSAVQLTLGAVDFDNAGGFSGVGVYTVQAAGTYRVYGKAKFANTASNWVHLLIYKNGSQVTVGPEFAATTVTDFGGDVHDLIQCNVGDTLAIYAQSSSSIATAIPDGGSADVYMVVSLEAWA